MTRRAACIEALRAARKRISAPRKFALLVLARDKDRMPCDPQAPEAVAWDLVGAVDASSTTDAARNDALRALFRTLEGTGKHRAGLHSYSDMAGHRAVLKLLDRTITRVSDG